MEAGLKDDDIMEAHELLVLCRRFQREHVPARSEDVCQPVAERMVDELRADRAAAKLTAAGGLVVVVTDSRSAVVEPPSSLMHQV